MGVYGTSAPLDSRDIDYDDDEEEYVVCPNCDEEFTEEEVSTLELESTWVNGVCEDCRNAYKKHLDDLIEEARDRAQEDWFSGEVVKSTY